MKLVVELNSKNINNYKEYIDGVILGLHNFSVFNNISYTIDEIKDISNKYKDLELFIKIDKNIFNNEIDSLKEILIELSKLDVKIMFYDLSILELVRKLKLDCDLVWSQTHMVTNYKTCNYYYDKGVKSALLSKEITLEEIKNINKLSNINTIVEVVSKPSVGYSRRKLVTNYNKDNNSNFKNLVVREKVTNKDYIVKEENSGTGFILDEVLNGTSVIKDLYESNTNYILMREIDGFLELVKDTKSYINNKCMDDNYIYKYKKLGDNTGFFFKNTIYRVIK
ncbi:MAG: U32 family peptidase [Bacilli bacterium]|nr:U32 family peptidase [Bacilli bacterium]